MQTTLLGIGIAIIVALLAALVGPLYVDWGHYRADFESSATRLTGLDFHVGGSIDARLLPTPTLVLHDVAFGRPDQTDKVRARALRVEFALGALVRGEWRVSDARIEGPQFAASLDRSGQVTWPIAKLNLDLEGIAIERLTIDDGRATFADAASGSQLTLEKLEFKGDLRSLVGPGKGEGSFVLAGQHYPYRLSTSRIGPDGSVRVRLSLDPIDRRFTADVDLSILIERGAPRFDGNIQVARAAGQAPGNGQPSVAEPWRLSARIKGDSAAAALDQVEIQYGPDERATKLKGTANISFGARPQINAALSSTQIDADRLLGLPEAARHSPREAFKTATQSLIGSLRLPIPASLSISVDAMTVADATLQRLNADVTLDGETLNIRGLDLHAPGLSELRVSGRVTNNSDSTSFAGSLKIEAGEPRALVAWLTARTDAQTVAAGPFRLGANVVWRKDKLEVDRLALEFERMSAAGRVAYAWSNDKHPARLDAALTSPDLDLDRIHVLAKAIFGEASLEWPREGAVSLKIGRAAIAGVEAKDADVQLRIESNGIGIERFAIADFGGATLTAQGRIGSKEQGPRGALNVELDGRELDGVLAVVQQLAPTIADQLRRSAARLTPATLRGSIALDEVRPGSPDVAAKLKIDGSAGALRLAFQSEILAAGDALKSDTAGAIAAAAMNATARVETEDASLLAELVAADRFLVVEKRPARLLLTAKGALDGDLAVDAQVTGALNASGNGTVRIFAPTGGAGAKLNIKVANANLRSPRRISAGRPSEVLPTTLTARVALSENKLQLADVAGAIAGTRVAGRLTVGTTKPFAVDGDLELSTLDLPAAIAVAMGMPGQGAAPGAGPWSAEPFDPALGLLNGQVAVKAARVALTPKLAARDVRGLLRFGESEVGLEVTDGAIAGGVVRGELGLMSRAEGLFARTKIGVTGANAAEMLPGSGAVSGRLTFDVAAAGGGMSLVALMGSLGGSGNFRLESGRLAGLDAAAFESVIRAVDQGLSTDANRVRDRTELALGRGGLPIALAEGTITIESGQARVSSSRVQAQGAELAISGSANLADITVDAQLGFSGNAGRLAGANPRPEIAVALKGPIEAPRRTVDVTAFTSWLALRSVDQQSKKLEALEGRAPQPGSPTGGAVQADPLTAPDAAVGARAEPDAGRPHPPLRIQAAKPKPSATEQAPPLPPPIDIRPAPGSRAPRAHTAPAAAPQQQKPAAAAPGRVRSLSEILFGN